MSICAVLSKVCKGNVGVIEECLKTQESDMREAVFDKIVEYELLIPRMEVEVSEK